MFVETMDDAALRAYELQFKISVKERLALARSYEDEEFDDIFRMSYGKFNKCDFVNYVSPRHMTVVKAVFNNVNFINCDFNDVIFDHCEFVNCKFINSKRMRNVIFEYCVIYDSEMPTDVKYNVIYDEEEVRLQNFINYMENHYELAVEFGKV